MLSPCCSEVVSWIEVSMRVKVTYGFLLKYNISPYRHSLICLGLTIRLREIKEL